MCYNKETPMGRWYDHTCKEKKNIFEEYRRKFFLTRSDYDRINMCKSRNDYRKICRRKRKEFHINKAEELIVLSRSNQRKFWNHFRKKPNPCGSCDFQSYFKNLYDGNSSPGFVLEEIIYEHDHDNGMF